MCGIIGIKGLNEEIDTDWYNTITQRGTFNKSVHKEDSVQLYHRRLRTIGSDPELTQPIWNEDKSIGVIHNGNIYNYKSLKSSMENRGHKVRSDCDSEVIIHLYEELGPKTTFNLLDGTFSVIVYDAKLDRMVVARDILGFKPLYFYKSPNDEVIFSSTIHSIIESPVWPEKKPEINKTTEWQIKNFKFPVNHNLTVFKDIYQVPPGTFTTSYSPHNSKRHTRIPRQHVDVRPKMIFDELTRSIEKRLVTEQPLIVTISGGIDSTSILEGLKGLDMNMDEIKTINIKFPGYDESMYAEDIAEYYGTDHKTVEMTKTDLPVKDMLKQYGSWADLKGLIPELAVNYAISKYDLGVTILNGNLPDELFGGYSRVEETKFDDLVKNHIIKTDDNSLIRHPYILDAPMSVQHARFYFDVLHEVPSYNFRKQDACGSMFALDVRNPYYTKEMIHYSWSTTPDKSYRNGKRKWIIRKMLKDRGVPERFFNRKKQYFAHPEWEEIDLKSKFKDIYSL